MAKFKVSMTWSDTETDETTVEAATEHEALKKCLYVCSTSRVVIERVNDPDSWPPKPGDVWEADGELYGVREYSIDRSKVVVYRVTSITTGSYCDSDNRPIRKLNAFKALNPELVKRPGGN